MKRRRVGLAPPILFPEAIRTDVHDLFEIVRSAVESFFGVFAIRGPRPLFNILGQSVLDRVVVNVIDVALQVVLVAYLVLPKPPLPDTDFSFSCS